MLWHYLCALIQITSCFYPLILFFFSLILIRLGFIWPKTCAGWFKCFLSFLFLNVIGGFAPCSKLFICSGLHFLRFWNILFLSKERICNHARQVSSVVSWTFWCVSLSFSLIGLLFSFSLTRPPPSIGPASLWTSSWDFHWTITKYKFKILNQLQIFY